MKSIRPTNSIGSARLSPLRRPGAGGVARNGVDGAIELGIGGSEM